MGRYKFLVDVETIGFGEEVIVKIESALEDAESDVDGVTSWHVTLESDED